MSDPLRRLRRTVRTHGVAGTGRRALARLAPPAPVDVQQLWYALDLSRSDLPRRVMEAGLELRVGTEEDVGLLRQLPGDPAVTSLDAATVRARLDAAATWWLVVEGERAAFSCWTFRERAPIWGARTPAILPPSTALLEDSLSSPDFRGRGVAPAAWSGIAGALAADGVRTLMTKVGADNAASRRAVEKAGFRAVGGMRIQRRGGLTRLRVRLVDRAPEHRWVETLARNPGASGQDGTTHGD